MGRRVRVAFVLPSFAGGGSQRVLLTLLGALDRAAFDPVLIVFSADGPLAGMVPPGLPVDDLGRARLRGAFPSLFRALRRARAGVVFSTMGHVNLAVLVLRPFLPGPPRVVIRESNTPSASLPGLAFSPVLRIGYRWLYPRADLVLCQSRLIARELAEGFGLPRERLRLLANPVDVGAVRRDAVPPVRAARDGLRFVAAGRLTRQKGFDALLELFAGMPADAHLTIAGDGPERPALEATVGRLGLAGRVALPGFVDRPWPLYAGADAFVLPSRWEGMPNAALEALACGTPVIASSTSGGLAEVAGATAPGAVTLAALGAPFREAMARVVPRTWRELGPSLLPPDFELSEVSAQFARCLAP